MALRRIRTLVLATTVVALLIPVAEASAGRLIVTGHDAEFHCSGGSQCHFVEVATNYVRNGAPDPSKPVLVLDNDQENGPGQYDFDEALDNAFGPGVVPRVILEPQSAEFATEPLTTDRYSAILIASDESCGGCDLNPPDEETGEENTRDSDAINARKADIEAFFNAGGGIYANAGADHGNGDPTDGADVFYNFVPIPVGGVQVRPPFCLTPDGAALGFQDPADEGGCPDVSKRTAAGGEDDINCCATHNSFQEPEAGTALKVAERDVGEDGEVSADDAPETLFAEGVISGGRIVDAVADLSITKADAPDPVIEGRDLTYTLTVRNSGPATATGVTVTDDLPGELAARSSSASQGTCSGTTTVTCSLGDMASGASATVTIVIRPGSPGTITNTARVSGNQPDPQPANNSATQQTQVSARPAVRARDSRAPVIAVAGVSRRSCVRAAFTATFRIRDRSRLRRLVITLDGRRIARTTRKNFSVRIGAASMRSGRHTLRVIAVDRAGNRRVASRSFLRCARQVPAPVFTG
jgi:uncharacterized repeat protein (TIGR01451 family)